jgi:nitroreductase
VATVDQLALPQLGYNQRLDRSEITRLVESATLAPSGGNSQPWQWLHHEGRLFVFSDPSRGSFLDIKCAGTHVALGAAAENLILEAHAMGLHVQMHPLLDSGVPSLVAAFTFARDDSALPHSEPHQCDHLVRFIPRRMTNRTLGQRQPIDATQLQALAQITRTVPGAQLSFLTADCELAEFAAVTAAVDRLRLLHPRGHHDFVREIRWTPEEARATRDGIDLDTIDLTATQRAGLSVGRSWPVVANLKQWNAGGAFEHLTRDAIDAASCVGLLTMPTWSSRCFFNGGRALQRFWLTATQQGIAVQPVGSVTFLFAVAELRDLRQRFVALFPMVAEQGGEILPLRLAIAPEPAAAALRRPVEEVLTFHDHRPAHNRTRQPVKHLEK